MEEIEPEVDANREFRTVVPDWLWNKYYLAFGRFMQEFAHAESALHGTIMEYVSQRIGGDRRTTHPILKAILAAQRVAGSRDSLNRIFRITKAPDEVLEEVSVLFHQLGEIHYVRDRLAHNGATPDRTNKEGWFYTSNGITVREYDKSDLLYFKPAHLDQMSEDLQTIVRRFHWITLPQVVEEYRADKRWEEFLKKTFGPWQYKASSLRSSGPRQKPTPPKPKPPRQSSRAKPQ